MLQYRIQIIWYGTLERRAKIQAASDLNSTQRTPMASPWVWSVFYCSSLHCSAVFCFGSVFYCSSLHYSSVFWFGSVFYCSSLHKSSVFWLLVCTLLFIVTSLYSITWRATSIELYLIVHCCFASLYSCIILACRSIIVVLLHFSMMKNLNVTNFLKLDKTNENHS